MSVLVSFEALKRSGFVSTVSVLVSFELLVCQSHDKPIGLSVARPKPCDRELKIIQIHKGGSIDEWNQKEKARTANYSTLYLFELQAHGFR